MEGIGLPARAFVTGLNGDARVGNGSYREVHRIDEGGVLNPYFVKDSDGCAGGAFIFRLGKDNWILGPILDSAQVVWASKILAKQTLPALKNDIWSLGAGSGHREQRKPAVTIYRCVVRVLRADDLASADLNGLSDPYVICHILEKPDVRFKTRIIKKNLNPVWDENHCVDGLDIGDTLHFQVMDWDKDSEDDELGSATLRVVEAGFNGVLGLTLRGRKVGSLRVEIHLPPLIKEGGAVKRRNACFDDANPTQIVAALSSGLGDAAQIVGRLETLVQSDEKTRMEVFTAGAVPLLVKLLPCKHESQRPLCGRCAGTLRWLAATKACRVAMIAAGAVPGLVALLRIPDTNCQANSLAALSSLAVLEQAKQQIIKAGGAGAAVRLMAGGEQELSLNAVQLLGTLALSEDDDNAETIITAGALSPLIAALSGSLGTSEALSIAVSAANALANLGSTVYGAGLLQDLGAVKPLVTMFSDGAMEGRIAAATALGSVAIAFECAEEMIAAGALPFAVAALRDQYDVVRDEAAKIFMNLTLHHELQELALSAGCLNPLIALLARGTPNGKGRAAAALANLGADKARRPLMLAAVRAVAKQEHSNEDALRDSLKHLCFY